MAKRYKSPGGARKERREAVVYRTERASAEPISVVVRAQPRRPISGMGLFTKGEITETLRFAPNVAVLLTREQLSACQEFLETGVLRYVDNTEPPPEPETEPHDGNPQDGDGG